MNFFVVAFFLFLLSLFLIFFSQKLAVINNQIVLFPISENLRISLLSDSIPANENISTIFANMAVNIPPEP